MPTPTEPTDGEWPGEPPAAPGWAEDGDLDRLAQRMLSLARAGMPASIEDSPAVPWTGDPVALAFSAIGEYLADGLAQSQPNPEPVPWFLVPPAAPDQPSPAIPAPSSDGHRAAQSPARAPGRAGPESPQAYDGPPRSTMDPPGTARPSTPAGLPSSLPAGAGRAALPSVPGSELGSGLTAAIAGGQDPSLISFETVGWRPTGRDLPLSFRSTAPQGPGMTGGSELYAWQPATGADPVSAPPVTAEPVSRGPTGSPSLPAAPEWPPRSYSEPTPATAPGSVRDDFPALRQQVHGRRLVWLDSAATTQKPEVVIETIADFYRRDNSNVHRGAHTLAARATGRYEQARETVRNFIGASSAEEIVFVRGTTEGVNLVARAFGKRFVRPGDEILVSHLEHHSNIVPWQLVCEEIGAQLRVIPVDDRGELRIEDCERLLTPRTRIVALTQVSNALGTLVPVELVVQMAHRHGVKVLVDGAQAVAHAPVNVQAMDADFYVFSGHKIYGPTGIGVVYGKRELLEALPPWQGGGNMIQHVTMESSSFAAPPARFEAGTGHIAGAVGLAAALDYVERHGRPQITLHEQALMRHMVEELRGIKDLRIIGEPAVRVGAVSFVIENREPREIAQHLDAEGIAVRAGHHCAQPILRRFGLEASVRPSLGIYNTHEDVDRLIDALRRLPAL